MTSEQPLEWHAGVAIEVARVLGFGPAETRTAVEHHLEHALGPTPLVRLIRMTLRELGWFERRHSAQTIQMSDARRRGFLDALAGRGPLPLVGTMDEVRLLRAALAQLPLEQILFIVLDVGIALTQEQIIVEMGIPSAESFVLLKERSLRALGQAYRSCLIE